MCAVGVFSGPCTQAHAAEDRSCEMIGGSAGVPRWASSWGSCRRRVSVIVISTPSTPGPPGPAPWALPGDLPMLGRAARFAK